MTFAPGAITRNDVTGTLADLAHGIMRATEPET